MLGWTDGWMFTVYTRYERIRGFYKHHENNSINKKTYASIYLSISVCMCMSLQSQPTSGNRSRRDSFSVPQISDKHFFNNLHCPVIL